MNARRQKGASERDPTRFECGDESTLDRFHAGTLSKKLHTQVETHLTTCSSCREITADFEFGTSIAGLLREAREEVATSLRQRLIETTTSLGEKSPQPHDSDGGGAA